MARTALPFGVITRTGLTPLTPTAGDVANGNSLLNDGETIFRLANSGSTASRTLTITVPGSVDGQAVTAKTETLAQSAAKWFGPYPTGVYGGLLKLNVDNAELTFECYRLGS
jgi:hypothetical protein